MPQPAVLRGDESDSLTSLEERINRAVELVLSLREENETLSRKLEEAVAERDAARAEAAQSLKQGERTGQELEELRAERRQVRTRIEKLLGQMDLLSNA